MLEMGIGWEWGALPGAVEETDWLQDLPSRLSCPLPSLLEMEISC